MEPQQSFHGYRADNILSMLAGFNFRKASSKAKFANPWLMATIVLCGMWDIQQFLEVASDL